MLCKQHRQTTPTTSENTSYAKLLVLFDLDSPFLVASHLPIPLGSAPQTHPAMDPSLSGNLNRFHFHPVPDHGFPIFVKFRVIRFPNTVKSRASAFVISFSVRGCFSASDCTLSKRHVWPQSPTIWLRR